MGTKTLTRRSDCASTSPATAIEPSALTGTWLHHRERDHDGAQVWVRGQQLPPSRFRGAMEIAEGGELGYRVLHPADAHYTVQGRWHLSGNTLTAGPKRYEIVSLEGDQLTLREL